MHRQLSVFLPAAAMALAAFGAAAGERYGTLQNPEVAKRPGYELPATAIDTRDIPRMRLAPDAAPDDPLPYYRIAPDTYMLYGNIAEVDESNRGWNGNAGFVVTPEGVVVIDSLGTPKLGRRLIATIHRATDKPIRYLILTHNHPDHSYGAAAFRRLPQPVTVIGHEGTLDYLNSSALEGSVAFRRQFIPEDMKGFEGVRPDVLIGGEPLTRQYTLELGGRTFDIYNAGKHHSAGDLVVHQVDAGIVWISDLAFNQRTTFMGDGHSKQVIEAENWLLEHFADARLMVPGHGSAQTAPFPMVAKTRSYVQRLREDMGHAVEEGLGLQEAVSKSDFPQWHDTRLYEENHKKNANFVYREMELELF